MALFQKLGTQLTYIRADCNSITFVEQPFAELQMCDVGLVPTLKSDVDLGHL